MTFGRPIVLVLLPVAVACVVLTLRARGYGRGRLLFLGLLRLLLLSCVLVALAKPSLLLPSSARHVVFLIDQSPSCIDRMPAALQLVGERVKRLEPETFVHVFRFDRRAYRDDSLVARDGSVMETSEGERLPEEGTDIASALQAALASIPSGSPGAVFLLSDGIETEGDAAERAAYLWAHGIPVYVPRPSNEPPADVRVAALEAPTVVSTAHPFALTCRLEATGSLAAQLELSRDGRVFSSRVVELKPDIPVVVTMVETLDEEGMHVYSARVTARGDRFPQNNSLATPVVVRARPLALYLSDYPGETPVEKLLKGLKTFRFRRLARGDELSPELLADASVVVLDNFSADGLGAKGADVASYVRDSGGGLVMIGGPSSFGVGRYVDTAVGGVLPVDCDPRDADKNPLALVVALDGSGSMGEGDGLKMELARLAAAQTLAALARKDLAGVIVFRVAPEVLIPLGPVGDSRAAVRTLRGVTPVGGTKIFPALERALEELAKTKLPLRHVVLLSDGKSLPGDAEGLVRRYKSTGVTLSSIATGKDADRQLLSSLAEGTGGRFYAADDITKLPELFLDDLRRIEGPLVRRGTLAVEVGTPVEEVLKGVDLTRLPTVNAYNRVRAREGAAVLLRHDFEKTPEPVLVIGRSGLGHGAALMLSFDETWTGGFARWDQWPHLLGNLLNWTRRTEPVDDYELNVRRRGGVFEINVRAEASLEAAETRDFAVALTDASGRKAEVPLERTGSRSYGGRAETGLEGVVSAVLVEMLGGAPRPIVSRYVPDAYADEFRELVPRMDTLERIARITGGRMIDDLGEFRTAGGRALRAQRDMTGWFIAFALALFVTELIGRAAGRL